MAATKKKAVKKAIKVKTKAVKAKVATKSKGTSTVKVKSNVKTKSAIKKAAATSKTAVKKAVTKSKATDASTPDTIVAKKTTTPKSTKPSNKPTAVKSVKPKKNLTDNLDYTDFTPYDIQKGEDYMNDEQVDHFREILTSWKNELMAKVDETVHHMQDEAANFPDPNDRATQESDFTMELRTRDRERKLIKKIEESLTALENEDYGYCTSCGIEVGIRRLEARPTATECIDCKTLNEIKEKQYGK